MTSHATESDIQMSGPGFPGRLLSGSGYSTLIEPASADLCNMLGTGRVGDGEKYLADDGTWKAIDLSSYATTAAVASGYVSLSGSYSNPAWITALAWSKLTGVPSAVSSLSGVNTGDQDLSAYATISGSVASFVALAGSYSNPTWITALAWSKLTGVPAAVSALSGTNTGDQDLSSYLTSSAAAAAYQPLNANLTTISGLSPSNDDFLQRKAGAWTNRNVNQVKSDLGLTGTNSGDQTITLTGDVTGSGTGSFAATIADSSVTLAKMASVASGTVFYRKTAGTNAPEVQTLATLKSDLGLTGTNSGDQDLSPYLTIASAASTYLTTSSAASTYQPLDSDLTAISALVPSNDDFIQRKAGAWTNRTVAQVKTDLGLTGTNSGDQTSIVGITGTKTQFNTACSDGDFLFVGDAPTSHTHGNITNAGAIGSTSGLPIITTTSGVLTTGAFGTTAGTFAEGNDSRITGALSSSTAATTYVPYTGASTNVNLGTRSLSCGAITMDGLFTTQAMILTGSSHQAWFKALNVGGVFRIQADPTSGIGVNITSTAIHPLDSNYTLGTNGSGFVAAHIGNSGSAAVIKATANTIVVRNEADSAAGGLNCGTVVASTSVNAPILYSSSATLDIRDGTTAQSLRLFTTYTSGTVFEAYKFLPTTTDVKIGLEVGSAGGTATRTYRTGHWDSSGTFVDRNVLATSSAEWWSDTNMILRMYAHGDINNGGILQSYKARGTDRNSRLYPVASDQLIGFNCYGWDENAGAWSGAKATWNISVPSTWTSTNNGTQHTWTTTDPTDATKTLQNRMRLHGNGNLAVGTITDASTRLHVLSTGTQLRLAYDSSNHMECSVSSAGAVTFNATGGSAAFAFSDPVSCTGSIVSSSGTGGIGYSTGAGGTVTQATSKSTGVTLNKVTGTITMNNAAMTYNTKVSFTLTNSAIAATDHVIVQHESGGTVGYYYCTATPAAGSATITVYLVGFTTGSLSEAIVLRFAVIKSVNS